MSGARAFDLQIELETVLVTLPRGDKGDELRVTHTIAKDPNGRRVNWWGVREFFKDVASGEMRSSKKGVSIRSKELGPIAEALSRAAREAQ